MNWLVVLLVLLRGNWPLWRSCCALAWAVGFPRRGGDEPPRSWATSGVAQGALPIDSLPLFGPPGGGLVTAGRWNPILNSGWRLVSPRLSW